MHPWATNTGNAYLEAKAYKKVFILAGPKFRELAGHLLLIERALYGLGFSGRVFEELLAKCLRELGFKRSQSRANLESGCLVALLLHRSHAEPLWGPMFQ